MVALGLVLRCAEPPGKGLHTVGDRDSSPPSVFLPASPVVLLGLPGVGHMAHAAALSTKPPEQMVPQPQSGPACLSHENGGLARQMPITSRPQAL